MPAHRVLVVDDNHEIRRMVTASIKTLGGDIDVLDVPSAEESLVISASLPIDLVVLDFRLPGMTGLEMVARLRYRKPAIKIIMVTGVEDAASRKEVAEADVAAYFFKPLEIGVFLDAVKRALGVDQGDGSSASGAPGTSGVPALSSVPGASGTPRVAPAIVEATGSTPAQTSKARPPADHVPGGVASKRAELRGFKLSIDERLNALKQQVRASSVLLVSEVGQVKEVAGNPVQITAGIALLPALMDAFRSSLRVSAALGRDTVESLLCFIDGSRRIYLAPVNESNLMLLDTSGFFEPDKLGMLDRAIHSAVLDLRTILENLEEKQSSQLAAQESAPAELPAEVTVDAETLKGVAKIFSRETTSSSQAEADDFWRALEESGALDGLPADGVISYDQARTMGLAPDSSEHSERGEREQRAEQGEQQ